MAISRKSKFKLILTFEIFIVICLSLVMVAIVYLNKINRSGTINKEEVNAKDIKGYTNIMLFGVDARGSQLKDNTRSDTMILCSINEDTKEVTLTSFYRDYYSFSPEKAGADSPQAFSPSEFDKLTHAYNDGAKAAIKAINTNFDLDVTDFVTVNFIALVRIIDELGGIEVDVPNYLVSEVNKYGSEIAKKQGEPFKSITSGGLQTLNGYQALGYSRTRKKDSDFKRSQRQREVINKVLEKLKSGKTVLKASKLYEAVASNIYTSFSNKKLLEYISNATKYKIREETNSSYGNGFPYNPIEFKPNGVSTQISKTPRDDIIKLHYILFNNGVLPAQYTQDTSTTSSSASPNESTTTSTTTNSSNAEGNGYSYTPTRTVELICKYLDACYETTK